MTQISWRSLGVASEVYYIINSYIFKYEASSILAKGTLKFRPGKKEDKLKLHSIDNGELGIYKSLSKFVTTTEM